MSIRINTKKAEAKWTPVLESMGITGERASWMAEYAEFHSINENAYVNASNVAGMGGVYAPQPAGLSGQTIGGQYAANVAGGTIGSGDVGQNLLPVAMKIAGQTIGLDLVAVKPASSPKIDLVFVDFLYDDTRNGANDERPQVFKLNATNVEAIKTAMQTGAGAPIASALTQGGLANGRFFFAINAAGASALGATISVNEPANKTGVVEFLGFSRIDLLPMFRTFRQANTAHTAVGTAGALWSFDQTRNTFNPTQSMIEQLATIAGVAVTGAGVEMISTFEDHLPGFVSNWTASATSAAGAYPMGRQADDDTYTNVIAPKISSKTVAVGTIEVSSALRRTDIEDMKAATGQDMLQLMESVIVNELSQTISKQIVAKVFEMGDLNRASAPLYTGSLTNIPNQTIFDLDTAYASSANVGGEHTHAIQRKLITKINAASYYISTEGRVGPAQYLVTNGMLASAIQDISGYTINPVKAKMQSSGQLYPVGQVNDIAIYVDPYMRPNDNRIVLGRKNNPDQPGIIFVPYLMAQSITLMSEATAAPRIFLRSRYAITEVGWYPQKQYMTIRVADVNGLLV